MIYGEEHSFAGIKMYDFLDDIKFWQSELCFKILDQYLHDLIYCIARNCNTRGEYDEARIMWSELVEWQLSR
jgi:hypothetical protein